jgi:hypothetical protein
MNGRLNERLKPRKKLRLFRRWEDTLFRIWLEYS